MNHYEDILLKEIQEIETNSKPIVIWGFGVFGKMALKVCKDLWKKKVSFICDIDEKKQGTQWDGIDIVSPEEAMKRCPDACLFVCVSLRLDNKQIEQKIFEEAAKLGHCGKAANSDIILYLHETKILQRGINAREYAQMLYDLSFSKNVLAQVSIIITEKCTLNCEYCGMYIPYKKPGKNLKLDDMIFYLEKILANLDGIKRLQIFGGEPFLHPQFDKIIQVSASYAKIGLVQTITNATLVLKEEQYKVISYSINNVAYSDYGSLSNKKNEIAQSCEKYGIILRTEEYNDEKMWNKVSLGQWQNYTKEVLKELYQVCIHTECLFSVTPDGLLNVCGIQCIPSVIAREQTKNELIDLKEEISREAFQEKIQEIKSKPYLDACHFCYGFCGIKNEKYASPAATQAKGKLEWPDFKVEEKIN